MRFKNLIITLSFTFIIRVYANNTDDINVSNEITSTTEAPQSNQFSITNLVRSFKSLGKELTDVEYSDFRTLAHQYIGNFEEYDVVTEDGYILKIFRIPGDVSKTVLLAHGVLATSDDFLTRGNISLVYMLAQEGFDVWAINFRGTRYSRRHKTLNPDTDALFWDYSMNERGSYDLPAVVDFVLNKTEQKQLSVVGHSEGCASFLIMTSTKPSYNDKIKVFVALAPVTYISDPGPAVQASMILYPLIVNELLIPLNVNEILGFDTTLKHLINLVCSQGKLGYNICVKFLIDPITGNDEKNLEYDFFYTILQHFPAGTSWKDLYHYVQVSQNGKFGQYDYGSLNREIYGTEEPPEYNLQNVKSKVALFVARNDQFLGLKEAEKLKNNLPNVVNYTIVGDPKFTHTNYIWGKSAHKILYPDIIDILYMFIK